MRKYPDGTRIPVSLPSSYKPSNSEDVPVGQSCSNCKFYTRGHCKMFLAPVKEKYWCSFWLK